MLPYGRDSNVTKLLANLLTKSSVSYYCYYYYYYLESAVQGRERVRTLYQSKDPNPTQPNHGRKNKKKIKSNKHTNNNDLLEKDGGTKNCIYKD